MVLEYHGQRVQVLWIRNPNARGLTRYEGDFDRESDEFIIFKDVLELTPHCTEGYVWGKDGYQYLDERKPSTKIRKRDIREIFLPHSFPSDGNRALPKSVGLEEETSKTDQ